MTFQSDIAPMDWSDRRAYGVARAQDHAFAALVRLWRQRKVEGMKQTEFAERLDRDTGWLSNKLKGPGNWTLKTFGEMVEVLDGELEIGVYDIHQKVPPKNNRTAYDGYELKPAPGYNLKPPPPPSGTEIKRLTVAGTGV